MILFHVMHSVASWLPGRPQQHQLKALMSYCILLIYGTLRLLGSSDGNKHLAQQTSRF